MIQDEDRFHRVAESLEELTNKELTNMIEVIRAIQVERETETILAAAVT